MFSIPFFFENTTWLWSMVWTGWVSTPASPRYPAGVSSPTHCDHLLVHIATIVVATITAVIDITSHHHLKNCGHLLLHVTDLELAICFFENHSKIHFKNYTVAVHLTSLTFFPSICSLKGIFWWGGHFTFWSLTVREDIEEGELLTRSMVLPPAPS